MAIAWTRLGCVAAMMFLAASARAVLTEAGTVTTAPTVANWTTDWGATTATG